MGSSIEEGAMSTSCHPECWAAGRGEPKDNLQKKRIAPMLSACKAAWCGYRGLPGSEGQEETVTDEMLRARPQDRGTMGSGAWRQPVRLDAQGRGGR